MRRHHVAIALAVGALCLTGCRVSYRSWHYASPAGWNSSWSANEVLLVPRARDQRPRHDDLDSSMPQPLIPLPFLPYTETTRQRPETPRHSSGHFEIGREQFGSWNPTVAVARATPQELAAAGIFRRVVFGEPAASATEGLILQVFLLSTAYRRITYWYGLSGLGASFWIVGLPSGGVSNELKLAFRVVDTRTGETVWSKTASREYHTTWWIYYRTSDFEYDRMLERILVEDIIPAMRRRFAP